MSTEGNRRTLGLVKRTKSQCSVQHVAKRNGSKMSVAALYKKTMGIRKKDQGKRENPTTRMGGPGMCSNWIKKSGNNG